MRRSSGQEIGEGSMRRLFRGLTRSVAWLGSLLFLLGGSAASGMLWAGDHDGLGPLTWGLALVGLLANRLSTRGLRRFEIVSNPTATSSCGSSASEGSDGCESAW